jgi:DNA-binding NtrC family response regulator
MAEWAIEGETVPASPSSASPVLGRAQSFLIVREADTAEMVTLDNGIEIVVGRGADAGIRVRDTQVSRAHARIHFDGTTITVRDLGSRNGTLVNGQRLQASECPLAAGSTIVVGACTIVVAGVTRSTATAPEAVEVPVADPEMVLLYENARRVAQTPTSVLLLGETGVGKEVLAAQIHRWSPRASKPFIRVNCAALPETLLEAELFGYERGAFSGAEKRKIGYFEAAHGGTLLIDEVGEIAIAAQVRLLNVLETRTVTRLGSTGAIPVDVRVICATNRTPQAEIAAGRFRSDLYYRIGAFTLRVPALRDRPAEIPLIARHFASALAREFGIASPTLSDDAREVLLRYSWPGNVRELRNAVEHALVMAGGGVLLPEHFPRDVRGLGAAAAAAPPSSAAGMRDHLTNVERQRIEEALAAEGGNQTRAAERLGMPRRTLVYKLGRYRRGE